MHFHLPKPIHGWRQFTGEVGIIVIGVLIALSAEAVVEHFREEHVLHQAEDRMTREVRDDDLPQAFARLAIYACNDRQIDQIEAAVEEGNREKFARLATSYIPPFRTWDDDAWKAAVASQALKAGNGDRSVAWGAFYVGMPLMNQWTAGEQEGLRQLRAKIAGNGSLNVVQQDRLLQLIADLRGANERLTGGSRASLRAAEALDIQVETGEKRAILAEARRAYGSCAAEPASDNGQAPQGQYEAPRAAAPSAGVTA